MLDGNTWNHLTVCKQKSSNNSFKNKVTNKLFSYKSIIYIYIYNRILYKTTHKGWYAIKHQIANQIV